MPLPLEGIRILDLGQFWAGPNAGRAWGDAGAEVIKVESCRRPDPLRIQARGIYPNREPGEDHWNRSGMVNERNRNKLGLALDLRLGVGRRLFLELVKVSDVVSQNFSTRVMGDLGLGYDCLSTVNPGIIMVSIASQGTTGPESDYVSYGPNLEQLGGISYFSGYPDEPYSSVTFALPDPLGGATAALAVLAALRRRDLTGQGTHIDLSQREAASLVVGDAIVECSMTGRAPGRLGNHEPGTAPQEFYPCRGEDEWIAISVSGDAEWAALCSAMERPELIRDSRFQTIIGRLRNRAELDQVLGEWTAQLEKKALMRLLQQWGVAAGAALNPRELFGDPHLRQRGFWERVVDYSDGSQDYYGRPMRLSLTPLSTRMPAPQLGQHSRQILGEILGLSADELDALEDQRVIGTRTVLTSEGGIASDMRKRP
jgi:crotonobetainyl-CoA:carnitine CoA-transferase CaiB-like acyl-CoA transferase